MPITRTDNIVDTTDLEDSWDGTVKDIVNKGAGKADAMQSIGTEVLKQGDEPAKEDSAEVVAEDPSPSKEDEVVSESPKEEAPTVDVEEVSENIEETEEVVEKEEQPALESSDNENKVLETIKKLDEGDGIYYDDLGIAVSLEGIDGPMLDEILDSLTDQGLIFQPRFNHYKEA